MFHGIEIDNENNIIVPTTRENQSYMWEGVNEISDWIQNYQSNEENVKEAHKDAITAVERLESWKRNYMNGDNAITSKLLTEMFGPALEFAKCYWNS